MSDPGIEQPLCVVSDVHLARAKNFAVGSDLAELVRDHAGFEIVFDGDTFDLSVDPPARAPAESVSEILAAHGDLTEALKAHVDTGGRVTFVAGNHDAAVVNDSVEETLRRAIAPEASSRLSIAPWFLRRGDVHIEHGHLHDPDNAPNHPLASFTPDTEPLGIALTRRFLAPNGAFEFAHSSETTPLGGLMRAFELYRLRAPALIARYFATAARLAANAGRQPGLAEERQRGAKLAESYAAEVGLDPDLVRELALSGAPPTHHRFSTTFFRLYLDRSLATLGLAGGTAFALAGSPPACALAALSAGYLGFSISRGVNRYGGHVEKRLRDAAEAIVERTRAELVVFGHSHRVDEAPGYLNPGSFAYPRRNGRSYVRIDRQGRGERCER